MCLPPDPTLLCQERASPHRAPPGVPGFQGLRGLSQHRVAPAGSPVWWRVLGPWPLGPPSALAYSLAGPSGGGPQSSEPPASPTGDHLCCERREVGRDGHRGSVRRRVSEACGPAGVRAGPVLSAGHAGPHVPPMGALRGRVFIGLKGLRGSTLCIPLRPWDPTPVCGSGRELLPAAGRAGRPVPSGSLLAPWLWGHRAGLAPSLISRVEGSLWPETGDLGMAEGQGRRQALLESASLASRLRRRVPRGVE